MPRHPPYALKNLKPQKPKDAHVHYTVLKQPTPPQHGSRPAAGPGTTNPTRLVAPHPNSASHFLTFHPTPTTTRHPPTTSRNTPSTSRHTKKKNILLRKEVIQPHLPVRLPCYDFVPITSPTFDSSLPQGVGPPASGVTDCRDVTGGVYKARQRIHRSVADLRLLATPTSWGRVADPNPN